METAFIRIRPYESRDFDRLCEIHDPARKNELALAGFSDAFLPLSIAAEQEDLFDYQLYVAEYDGSVSGFVAFTEDKLAWLYVDVALTRCGIGSSLLQFALSHMKQDMFIEVLAGNAPAIALYRRFGFSIDKTILGVLGRNESFPAMGHVMKQTGPLHSIYAETEHLILRSLTWTDYEIFVEGFLRCRPEQNRFDDVPGDVSYMTPDWYRALLSRRDDEAASDRSYVLHIFSKADGSSVGYCDVTPHLREEFQYGRIGYTLHNYHWGKGYGTECTQALAAIGFDQLHLHRLEAHVNLDNPASARVLEKAGFKLECIREGFIYEDGSWRDQKIYVRLNPNWTPQS